MRHLSWLLLAVSVAAAAGLTPEQQRGREIYQHGVSADGGTLAALLLGNREPIDARLLPCSGCHAPDGHGRAEGGVRPADITPAALGQELRLGQRHRPAYSAALLTRAITMGIDSAGNPLDRAMPRFQLRQGDAADLRAYLEALGSEDPPGVSDDAIRINIVGAPRLTAPAAPIYGRSIVLQRPPNADALLTIDLGAEPSTGEATGDGDMLRIVLSTQDARPGGNTFVLSASVDDQRAALRTYARDSAQDGVLFDDNCDGMGKLLSSKLALMSSNAAGHCDLRSIPLAVDRRVVVAAPVPPGEPQRDAIASAVLQAVVRWLEQIGRDLDRTALRSALEHSYRIDTGVLPPLSWTAGNHFGTRSAWLMTLDLRQQKMRGEPGWISAGSTPADADPRRTGR